MRFMCLYINILGIQEGWERLKERGKDGAKKSAVENTWRSKDWVVGAAFTFCYNV